MATNKDEFFYKIWDLDKQEYATGRKNGSSAAKKVWSSQGAASNAITQGTARHVKNYEIHKFRIEFVERVK